MSMQFLINFAANDEGFLNVSRRASEYAVVQGVALSLDAFWLYCWRVAQEVGERGLDNRAYWGYPWFNDAEFKRRLFKEQLGVFPRAIVDNDILQWRPHIWEEWSQRLGRNIGRPPILVTVYARPSLSANEPTPSVDDLQERSGGLRVIVRTEPQSVLCSNPRRKHVPVPGGVSIGTGPKDFATLGIVLENDRAERFALTCAHAAGLNDNVVQPSRPDSKSAVVIGTSVVATGLSACSAQDPCNDRAAVPNNELDLSLIKLEPSITSEREILDIGALNGVVKIASLSSGQTVEVMGRTCKYKVLQLGSLHAYHKHLHNGKYYCYKNLVRVESPYGATNVIKGGDSGAPVCLANGAGKGLCAIMVASNVFGGFAMFAESAETWWTKQGTFTI